MLLSTSVEIRQSKIASWPSAFLHSLHPKLPVSALDFEEPLQFWDILSAAMNENPPPEDEVTALLPQLGLAEARLFP
jgi:hypothetical protein